MSHPARPIDSAPAAPVDAAGSEVRLVSCYYRARGGEAMRQPIALLQSDIIRGDAGNDEAHNHRLCREQLSVHETVITLNPRNTSRRWPEVQVPA